jgi:hypothetical protein
VTEYYFDSSALVKRYAREAGTDWVLQATDPASGHETTIGRVTGAEVLAAIVRKRRQGAISTADADQAMMEFETDFETEYHILEVTPSVIQPAMNLVKIHGLRGYDSMQLACALEANELRLLVGLAPFTFVSADDELNRAAQAEALLVENPNHYS